MERDAELDRADLANIFCVYHEQLCLVARGFVSSRALAEEIVQDAFLSVWRRRPQWPDALDLKGYTFAVVRNVALNRLRRLRVERRWQERAAWRNDGALSQYATEAAHSPDVDEATELLRRVVQQLPKRVRVTIILRLQFQLTNIEIADVMGITLSAVDKNFRRGIRALRVAMGATKRQQ